MSSASEVSNCRITSAGGEPKKFSWPLSSRDSYQEGELPPERKSFVLRAFARATIRNTATGGRGFDGEGWSLGSALAGCEGAAPFLFVEDLVEGFPVVAGRR